MTFKATSYPAWDWIQTELSEDFFTQDHPSLSAQPGYSYVLFLQNNLFFPRRGEAKEHRVLDKGSSCPDEHVLDQVTFAQDRGLTIQYGSSVSARQLKKEKKLVWHPKLMLQYPKWISMLCHLTLVCPHMPPRIIAEIYPAAGSLWCLEEQLNRSGKLW